MKQNKHILVRNIYYMLSYAFQVLKQENYEDMSTEEFDNIHNLFAAILAKGISQQLKQGLYREYVPLNEERTMLRGKIDITGTIRNKIAHRQVLACEYDELSENNLLNQILKAIVFLLLKSKDVEREYKDVLKKEMLFFSGVELVALGSVSWKSIRFNRNNQTYRMLISLCQLIVEGMLLSEDKGEERLASFMDEQRMCRLYEKFILEYYRKHYPHLLPAASQIEWAIENNEERTLLPTMQSDIMLTSTDRVLIIDAKYYSHTLQTFHGRTSIHSGNLYQIFTYVKNKAFEEGDIHRVAGMLLYAQTDEDVQPNESFHISGNRIDVRTIGLNQDFDHICQQLDDIVHDFF